MFDFLFSFVLPSCLMFSCFYKLERAAEGKTFLSFVICCGLWVNNFEVLSGLNVLYRNFFMACCSNSNCTSQLLSLYYIENFSLFSNYRPAA